MTTKQRILVTRSWPKPVEDRLSRTYDATLNADDVPMAPEAIASAFSEYDAICPTVSDKLPADIFPAGTPRAKILGNYGVGFSHIDTDAAKAAGIVVTNTPDVLSECTADLAITLMLMAARRASEGEREVRAGKWAGWRPTHMVGTKVSGATFGILGFGRIGRTAARRAHHGFGMKVIYYDAFPVKRELAAESKAEARDSIEAVLREADVVSLHMPGGKENYHLINAERLAMMKPTAILVNTARGEVVDAAALAEALLGGTIAGAGLDVYEGEPTIPPPLLETNAVLLPHLGSATRATREAMGMMVADNLDAFFAGKEPPNRVA
ncbi:D-glycerate dehydrogenase [Aurantimonas sp. VKM B-3413]|uniref:2-hydroxyacid dehydrogenase n=1 Tax=Aurantimonas sp. VKM B-3413 TaxID=2779401 RepID=UPI001E38C645|nr:D-glycerate dehydrogenase [Aurantimonas sp. VKM B-3413]MCB8839483.1 D-glycerate dehydrogenase [Aurantimonas sp. VKM B-3413]